MKAAHATWEQGLVIPEPIKSPEERILDALVEIQRTLEMFRVDFLRTRREQILTEEAPPVAAKKGKAK